MLKQERRVKPLSFRAEIKARLKDQRRKAKRPKRVRACRDETLATLRSLKGAGRTERAARVGWLKARCAKCRLCSLG
jgi:hypothetical protein